MEKLGTICLPSSHKYLDLGFSEWKGEKTRTESLGALVHKLGKHPNLFTKWFIVRAFCSGKSFHQSIPTAQVEDSGGNSVQ